MRYMDDFVFFAKSRPALKRIIKQVYSILDDLKLTLAKPKTFIGKCNKGFDFLGYHIGGRENSSSAEAVISVAKQSFVRMAQKVYWLYEQQARSGNFALGLDRYLKNWVKWAKAGLREVIRPKEIHFNLNKNVDLELRWQLRYRGGVINNQLCPSGKSYIFVL